MEVFLSLAVFAFVSSITPGPNNLMLMASGANFGLRPTLPHMFGVALGFSFMVFLVGIGIIQLFDMFPVTYTILKWFSVAYLSYLAFKIATTKNTKLEGKTDAKPMTFLQAVLFQWVNPKAWTMALTAISLYAPERNLWSVVFVTMVFGLINLPSISVWTVLGQKLSIVLTSAVKMKIFNYTMATLLLLSMLPSLLQGNGA